MEQHIPGITSYTVPVQADGAEAPSATTRPSLRAAREKAEEARRLAIKDVHLPGMSERLGFDLYVKCRRMTLQEVVTSGNAPDELREYADVLMGAMTSAAMKARGGKDASAAQAEAITLAAVEATQTEFGAVEFTERQRLSRDYSIMCACVDPMIVESDDPNVYTDPDNMLILSDIPESDLVILYAAISRNEQEAVLTDLKSVPAEPEDAEGPQDAESGADDSPEAVPAPEASRVPTFASFG
jgi:hypothetical protein